MGSMSTGVLARLCGGAEGCASFLAQHHGRAPVLFRGAAEFACSLVDERRCERLLSDPAVDVMLARLGRAREGRPNVQEARTLFVEGFTWVLRDVDRADAGLAELGRGLASDLHGTLHLQVYRTPAGLTGFGWHFDPEEVFLFQVAGSKRFRLRENTQHPLPLAGRMPTQLLADAEPTPVVEHELQPGDALYIPAGWWHIGQALEASISISAGVRAPTFIDALAFVTAELAREPRWRARLPTIGRAAGCSDDERRRVWSDSLGALRSELERRLSAPDLPAQLYAHTGWWKQPSV
jgi:ribosomal protein L16 Arg81 hydroxylase